MPNVAIVGAGPVGRTHARCYREHGSTPVVAVCDLDFAKARALAEEFGARPFDSVERMLESEAVDIVSIATRGVENGSHHFEPVMQSLEAGKAVLCEKPISNDIEEGRQMVARAREKNVPFGINLNHRFTPAAERLKQWQNEGKLGEVLFVNMALWLYNPNEPTPWQHIRALHPHSIDVMRYFGGDIARVQCFMTKSSARETLWSTFSLNVQFASGAVGHLTGSQDMSGFHPIERCEVGGSKGRGIIENVYERLEFLPRESREKVVIDNGIFGGMASFQDTFKNRINKFVEQVQSGEELEASGEDGLAAQEVIEAAIRSFENKTVEDVVKNGFTTEDTEITEKN